MWNFASPPRPIRESTVSREMTRRYMSEMIDYAETDVCLEAIIVRYVNELLSHRAILVALWSNS